MEMIKNEYNKRTTEKIESLKSEIEDKVLLL